MIKVLEGIVSFLSLESAFNSIKKKMTVKDQRELISKNIEKEQFETYKNLYESTQNEIIQTEKINILKLENSNLSKEHKAKVAKAKAEKDKPKQKLMLKEIVKIKKTHGSNKDKIKQLLNEKSMAEENIVEFSFIKC